MNKNPTNANKKSSPASSTANKTVKKKKLKSKVLSSTSHQTDKQQTSSSYVASTKSRQLEHKSTVDRQLTDSPSSPFNGSSEISALGADDANYISEDSLRTVAQAQRQTDTISLSLLARRCIDNYKNVQPEQIMDLLNEITHVRLDREVLHNIDGLELLGQRVRNLYLQHNEISEISGLETLTQLRFLTLSNNRITEIRNLKNTKLGFLDLSHNAIEHINVDELPTSLVILNLEGNPCQNMDDYRDSILRHCHQLSQLDGEPLTVDERRMAGHEVSSESEESDDDVDRLATPYDYNRPFDAQVVGVFDDLSSDIFIRCQSRIQHVFDEHRARVVNLERIKAEGGIVTEDGAVSNPISRISSRLDSPDTTDSSRPDTGNKDDNDVNLASNLSNMPTIPLSSSSDGTFPTDGIDLVTNVERADRGGASLLSAREDISHPPTLSSLMFRQGQAWENDDII